MVDCYAQVLELQPGNDNARKLLDEAVSKTTTPAEEEK